ncbi:MAG TPA: DUF1801 domain-containing protein, partial [Bacteroidia bacterium]|nr:DUF1801 domain-containing protein [Bacteroidia bacterium]
VDNYIAALPPKQKAVMKTVRATIKKAAPKATELLSYGMPAFKLDGMLCYFSALKNHYSLFPMRSGVTNFLPKLKKYSTSAGTIRFSYDEPVPVKLITEIVKFRVKENKQKAELKKMTKKKAK